MSTPIGANTREAANTRVAAYAHDKYNEMLAYTHGPLAKHTFYVDAQTINLINTHNAKLVTNAHNTKLVADTLVAKFEATELLANEAKAASIVADANEDANANDKAWDDALTVMRDSESKLVALENELSVADNTGNDIVRYRDAVSHARLEFKAASDAFKTIDDYIDIAHDAYKKAIDLQFEALDAEMNASDAKSCAERAITLASNFAKEIKKFYDKIIIVDAITSNSVNDNKIIMYLENLAYSDEYSLSLYDFDVIATADIVNTIFGTVASVTGIAISVVGAITSN